MQSQYFVSSANGDPDTFCRRTKLQSIVCVCALAIRRHICFWTLTLSSWVFTVTKRMPDFHQQAYQDLLHLLLT